MDQQNGWGVLRYPFGAGLREKIEGGDADAAATGMVCVAAHLLNCAGIEMVDGVEVTRSMLLTGKCPQSVAMAAAALDIIEVLRISPAGKKALAEFFSKPRLQ